MGFFDAIAQGINDVQRASKPHGNFIIAGNKKIGTIMKNFSKQYPHLFLSFAVSESEWDTLLSRVRTTNTTSYTIHSTDKIGDIEEGIQQAFGIKCEICYSQFGIIQKTDSSDDRKTLDEFESWAVGHFGDVISRRFNLDRY